MADKRMFSKSVVLSDAFLDMPHSARSLYLTLGISADDDGFIGNPKSIMRLCGASQDDMAILISKRYLLSFPSGVVCIKHWKMNNLIQKDRYKETTYIEEKSTLMLDDKGAYTEKDRQKILNVSEMDTKCIQDGYTGKDRLGKDRLGKESRHKHGQYQNVLLSDEDLSKLKEEFPSDWQQRIERLSEYIETSGKSYKNHLATIRAWARKDKSSQGTASYDSDKYKLKAQNIPTYSRRSG